MPEKVDVLVIGGGNAAMCAAISARKAGADVMVLEHAHKRMRGGNSRHTRNLRAMHLAPTETLTQSYTEEEYWQDLLRVTEGNTNEPLARMMICRSAELVDWLGQQGVRFQPPLSGTLSLGRTNAFFLGGGRALVNAQYHTAEKLGIKVFYNTEVQELDIEDGVFQSAKVVNRGFACVVKADAVVVASGGFQANIDWMKQAWGDVAENFIIRGTPYNRGRILKDLMAKGIKSVGDPAQCHAVAIDARAPKFDGGIVTRLDCVCFSIVVNKDGQRFYDEGEDFWPKRYAIWGRLVAQQPDQIGYAIIDAKVIDNFMPSVFPPIKADTIADLAGLLGLDPPALEKTVAEFNAAVKPGTYDTEAFDDCCTQGIQPPKTHWALPLDTPPYYAYPLRPGITFTYLGVKVNEKAQVLMENGAPTRNIYAAGEIMVGNVLGKGYCAGTGMSIGSVFGRIAGEEAACSRTK
ncbi:MAG: FAD-dependent tricarballylate dehydrogenase TcuA [Pseudomonadota bacterium]